MFNFFKSSNWKRATTAALGLDSVAQKIRDLTAENDRLTAENESLKGRLSAQIRLSDSRLEEMQRRQEEIDRLKKLFTEMGQASLAISAKARGYEIALENISLAAKSAMEEKTGPAPADPGRAIHVNGEVSGSWEE
jgi:predicted nuclease with TOPRIM domain